MSLLHDLLSPREREIMDSLLREKRPKEIAHDLGLSVKTVSTHRFRLLRKLGIGSDLGLLRYALRHGLATLDE